jgi:hypothetical protein
VLIFCVTLRGERRRVSKNAEGGSTDAGALRKLSRHAAYELAGIIGITTQQRRARSVRGTQGSRIVAVKRRVRGTRLKMRNEHLMRRFLSKRAARTQRNQTNDEKVFPH